MKKKVLLLLNNLNIGGVQSFCVNVANNMPNTDFIFFFLVEGKKEGFHEQFLKDKGCQIFHAPSLLKRPLKYISFYKKILKENDIDIVHGNLNFLTIIPFFFTSKKINRICHAHASYDASSLLAKIFRFLFRVFIGLKSDVLLSCSEKSGKWLYGKRKYIILPNGINIKTYRFDLNKRNFWRSKLGIKTSDVVFISVGSLVKIKRQDFLISSFERIHSKNKNIFLLILGEGSERQSLETLIQEKKLFNNILLLGNKDNVGDYLSAADLFVFASIFEGSPMCLIEACANGLKCLISNSICVDNCMDKNIIKTDVLDLEKYSSLMINDSFYIRNYLDLSKYDISNTILLLSNIYNKTVC